MFLFCISQMIGNVEHFFYMLKGHLCIFGEMLLKFFVHFFNWIISLFRLLSFRCSIYILDFNPSWDIWFANSFSHSIGYLFTVLLILWLLILKSFTFWCPSLSVLLIYCLCFWCHIVEIIAKSSDIKLFTYVFFE